MVKSDELIEDGKKIMGNVSEKKVYKFIIFLFLMNLFIAIIINTLLIYMGWSINNTMISHLQLLLKILCHVIPVLYFLRKNKIQFTKLTNRRIEAKILGLPLFMTILLFLINTGIASLFEAKIGPPTSAGMSTSLSVSAILLIIIISPIIEEILFRGILFQSQITKSITNLVLMNALAFSLFHFNIYQLIPTFLVGVFLTYVVFIYRNLYLVILLHMIYNSLVIIFSVKTTIMYQLYIMTNYGLLIFFLALTTFLLLFAILIINNRKKI